jgi:site-specific DNA-methyltransferase (adenine-specific)
MKTAAISDVLGGRARWCVVQADCLEALRSMPDACVDAIVTDPPYSSGGFTRGDRTGSTKTKYTLTRPLVNRPGFAGDNRDQRSFGYWCTLWLSECLRVAKLGAPICVFSDWRQLPTTTDVLQAGGFVWRGLVVWDKTEACRPAMGLRGAM